MITIVRRPYKVSPSRLREGLAAVGAIAAASLAAAVALVAGREPQPDLSPTPSSRNPARTRPPRKREIPAKLKLGLGAAGLLLVIIVALGGRGPPPPPAAAVSIDDEMVVSAEDLKDRREVRADDFRPKRQFLKVAPRASTPSPRDADSGAPDLEARRARRDAHPDYVLTTRKSRSRTSSQPDTTQEPFFEGPVCIAPAREPRYPGHRVAQVRGSSRPVRPCRRCSRILSSCAAAARPSS